MSIRYHISIIALEKTKSHHFLAKFFTSLFARQKFNLFVSVASSYLLFVNTCS